MNSKKNAQTESAFSGSIPRHYDQYLGPMFFEPYAIIIAERINSLFPKHVLELACGTGRVTNHLRRIIPAASKLTASDISTDMLAIAQEKLRALNIDFRIIDAQQLPFYEKSIDVIVCCFGYMFVPDKSKAFAEAYRVLKPGGTLLFTTWDKLEYNEASHVFRKHYKKYFPEELPESYDLPCSMHEAAVIEESLRGAGFSKIKIEKIEKTTNAATAKEAAFGLTHSGSLYNEIIKRNPLSVDEITEKVEKELSEKYGAAPMIAPMRAVVSQAWK